MIKNLDGQYRDRVSKIGLLLGLFLIFSSLFLAAAAQEAENVEQNASESGVAAQENKPEITETVEPVVNDLEAQKAMEAALQEIVIKDAQAYYPLVRGIHTEFDDRTFSLLVEYDQPEGIESINTHINILKDAMRAELNVKSNLLFGKDESKFGGDERLVKSVSFIPDPLLSSRLEKDSGLAFLQTIRFDLLRPVLMRVVQSPGILRIEIRAYTAKEIEEEEKRQKEDILFQPPPPETTTQILGESYANEREYEENIANNNEPTLLDDVRDLLPQTPSRYIGADYSRGFSADAVRQDMLARDPSFGSMQYWKKHISGLISNTTRMIKRDRGKEGFINEIPGFAVEYQRRGVVGFRTGYSLQREFPFLYSRQGRTAAGEGFMRQDIESGLVYQPQRPWVYSLQHKLAIASSKNLSDNEKFGDRLNTYRYDVAQGVRYKLKRGFFQFGSGIRFQTEELGVRKDAVGYLTALWVRPLTARFALRTEYNYSHTLLFDPEPERQDRNVHKMRLGAIYRPIKDATLTPSVGWAFYDGRPMAGFIGGMNYQHNVTGRDRIGAGYLTDIIRPRSINFGSESLSSVRNTINTSNSGSSASEDLIRYQRVNIYYRHELTPRTAFNLSGEYRRERQLEAEESDEFDEYRVTASVTRLLPQHWSVELKYEFIYLDALRGSNDTGIRITRDEGNTNHTVSIRLLRYFGERLI